MNETKTKQKNYRIFKGIFHVKADKSADVFAQSYKKLFVINKVSTE